MDFRFTLDVIVYDTKVSKSFLGDFCPSCQRAHTDKATMQNLKTKKGWLFYITWAFSNSFECNMQSEM